jgi:hypothetical protein
MRRGFVYSLAALALALAVAQAAIIFSSESAGAAYGRTSQKDAVEFAAFSEGVAGMRSGLLLSCSLAAAAAKEYEESTNTSFVNKSCALSFLARNGNVTGSDCPGEAFALIGTSDGRYSLRAWSLGNGLRKTGTIGVSDELLSVYATANGTHATCYATASVTAATIDNSTSVSRTYAATRTVANG